MYLTPQRVDKQLQRIDKACRILWRLYSPYRSHRVLIAKAVYNALNALESLEQLLELVKKDYQKEVEGKTSIDTSSTPPGYYRESL